MLWQNMQHFREESLMKYAGTAPDIMNKHARMEYPPGLYWPQHT